MSKPVPQFDSERPWGQLAPTGISRWLIRACHGLSAKLPLLYRIALILRRPLKYGADHAFDVTVWGLRLRLLPRGNISEAKVLFTPQFFDRAELDWLASHLLSNGTFVDIGANAGAYSLAMRSRFGAGIRILAVEPDPEMRRRIAFNLASNGIQNIEICPVALSDKQGEAQLELSVTQRGQNALVDAPAGANTLTVPVDTLASLLQSRGVTRVDAFKIDVEGHEIRVLGHFFANAPQSLWPKAIVTEYKDDTCAEILRILGGAGYVQVRTTKLNWMFERRNAAVA